MKISKDKKKQILDDKKQLSIQQLSKKYKLSLAEIQAVINASPKKSPKWFYVISISIPIIFLIALEIFLRIINYGYNFDQWVDAGQSKFIINPNIGKKYFTTGNFVPSTIEDVFDQHKKTNSFRVFVLGGSSAQGFPYNPMGSFSRYIRKRLELAYPDTKIEVVNIGMTAVNSYTVLDLLPGVLDQNPDLILIYAGHNEYYGALGVGSVQSFGSSRTLIKLMLSINEFKITQLLRSSIQWITSLFISENSGQSKGTLMSRMAKDKYIILDSEEFNAGLRQFRNNLTDILHSIKDKNVPVILGRLVCNLKDQKPFISEKTPGSITADQVYEEARHEFKESNFNKANSLFKQAKDLDVLRFRAPEKINKIINDLGKKFEVPTISIDSIFSSESPEGIVGDNLIIDHLHPNLKGYQLIGKTFYDCMEKYGYLPKTENAKVLFDEQDSLTRINFVFTRLDSVLGNYYIKLIKSDWPYTKERTAISEFQSNDFFNLFQPENFIDSIAVIKVENKISWADAHLIAATYHLRRDKLEDYLKYMNVLIYQYPNLRDLDGALKFFFGQHKIDLKDFTPKRNGLMAMYIGNLDNAVRHLSKAYKLNPNDQVVLYNLSLAYFKKNDFQSALKLINECLIANSDYPEADNLKKQILNQIKN